MAHSVWIGDRTLGEGEPCYLVAEIGINHNGSIESAKQLIDIAHSCGFDAVKFQKRTAELCVPPSQRDKMRETPWGYISYMEYRAHVEFEEDEYSIIDKYCKDIGIDWFASAWDTEALAFLEKFDPICVKLPSALTTNLKMVEAANATGRTVFLSTGMTEMEEIERAVALVDQDRLMLAHCTSTYPCPLDELNLRMISSLRNKFDCAIGYSGHEVGLQTSVVAVGLGASFIERHITLDRALWGSDQSASIEPVGMKKLVEAIRSVETAMGDGTKRVYPSERHAMERLKMPVQ
ncbi:N-acetylneuraminate synthase family protein [Rhodospirillales bacterium]|nr:N-acetylneuraminate synthase family protein [Rhodospirillales bacterium]